MKRDGLKGKYIGIMRIYFSSDVSDGCLKSVLSSQRKQNIYNRAIEFHFFVPDDII